MDRAECASWHMLRASLQAVACIEFASTSACSLASVASRRSRCRFATRHACGEHQFQRRCVQFHDVMRQTRTFVCGTCCVPVPLPHTLHSVSSRRFLFTFSRMLAVDVITFLGLRATSISTSAWEPGAPAWVHESKTFDFGVFRISGRSGSESMANIIP